MPSSCTNLLNWERSRSPLPYGGAACEASGPRRLPLPCTLTLLALTASICSADPVATDLAAEHRHGQTFLTWDEPEGLEGMRFQVLLSDKPITDVGGAQVVGDYIRPSSATDWWLNPETYGKPLEPDADGNKPFPEPEGWIIRDGAPRLDPHSGLFVYTVTPETSGERYFAVVALSDETGQPLDSPEPGANSLAAPIAQQVGEVVPIWQGDPADRPAPFGGQGLPLDLHLHAKRGRGGMDYLVFGDSELGWRDGLPYKFGVGVTEDAVEVRPTDRTWIGRVFPEGRDECQRLTPAIHSFWFGYSDRIFDPAQMPEGACANFTEQRLLRIIDWVKRTYGTDPNRTYSTGGSMGGCGTMSFAFRRPEIFAAVSADVPIVTYGKGPVGDSSFRVEAYTGPLDAPYGDGTLHERLDAEHLARTSGDDLPFLVISVGRKDTSIPWGKNPPFFRAMQEARQGMIAAWNEGTHGDVQKLLPPDVRERMSFEWLHRFALNKSYLALSNASADGDPGQGPVDSGDPVGYMNRGLDWQVTDDTPERYLATVSWALDAAALPVTVDVTPRRVQGMDWHPGDRVHLRAVDEQTGLTVDDRTVTVDATGLLTAPSLQIRSPEGTTLVVTPAQ